MIKIKSMSFNFCSASRIIYIFQNRNIKIISTRKLTCKLNILVNDHVVWEDVENSELIIITDPNEVNELKKLGAKFERIDLTVLNYPDPLTTWSEI